MISSGRSGEAGHRRCVAPDARGDGRFHIFARDLSPRTGAGDMRARSTPVSPARRRASGETAGAADAPSLGRALAATSAAWACAAWRSVQVGAHIPLDDRVLRPGRVQLVQRHAFALRQPPGPWRDEGPTALSSRYRALRVRLRARPRGFQPRALAAFTFGDDDGDRGQHLHLVAAFRGHLRKHAGGRRLDVEHGLVRLDHVQRLALLDTNSPSCLSQATKLSVSTVCPSGGTNTCVGMIAPLPIYRRPITARTASTTRSSARHVELLHHRREGRRHVGRGDAHDRRVEPEEGFLGDDRGELAGPAAGEVVLLDDHQPAGLLHRLQDQLLVERHEGARVDHLGVDALLRPARRPRPARGTSSAACRRSSRPCPGGG